MITSRQSDRELSLRDLSVRDGASMSQDQSLMPRSFLPSETGSQGVAVMRVGLNDPNKKSLVISQGEFS